MRARYKNNMTRREIIGQKRLIITIKPALLFWSVKMRLPRPTDRGKHKIEIDFC